MAPDRKPIRVAWGVLAGLFAVELVHEVVGFGGETADDVLHYGVFNALMVGAAALCLVRAAAIENLRAAWTLIGLSLVSFALGSLIWTIHYADVHPQPFPTATDGFWLAYYVFAIGGLALLARARIIGFDLQRWIDGVAVALIAATPVVALVLQPALEEGEEGSFIGRAVEIAYPIADILLLGAILGIFAIAGWRAGRTWVLLGAGLALIGIADTISAAEFADGTFEFGRYNYLWTGGALLIAYAAWQPDPEPSRPAKLVGWRAIALPVACQLIAAGIQVYILLGHHIPESERIVAVLVMALVVVQLWVSRPKDG